MGNGWDIIHGATKFAPHTKWENQQWWIITVKNGRT
jgi:hypothetical protein